MAAGYRAYVKNKYHQDFYYDIPLITDSDAYDKEALAAHQGKTITFPSLIQLSQLQEVAAEAGNPSEEAMYSSEVKVELLKHNRLIGRSRLEYLTTIEATTQAVADELMANAKRCIHLDCVKVCRWGGAILRADGDTNFQQFGYSTSDGDTTSSLVVDAALPNDNDRFNGGQVVVYDGKGQGQGRPVFDYVGSTGQLKSDVAGTYPDGGNYSAVDSGGPFPPYYGPFTQATDSSAPVSYHHVATAQGITSGDRLTTQLILLGQFYHNEKFRTRKMSGPMSHRLYITQYGRNDLLGADNTFQQAIQNYHGEGFRRPDHQFYEWFGTKIRVMSEGFRSATTADSYTCAEYSNTGAAHYYPMFGAIPLSTTKISLDSGQGPGALDMYSIMDRDSNNPEPAKVFFGYKIRFVPAIRFATNCINLTCGNPQA